MRKFLFAILALAACVTAADASNAVRSRPVSHFRGYGQFNSYAAFSNYSAYSLVQPFVSSFQYVQPVVQQVVAAPIVQQQVVAPVVQQEVAPCVQSYAAPLALQSYPSFFRQSYGYPSFFRQRVVRGHR